MSREKVEVLHRAFDAFRRRDLDAFLGSVTSRWSSSRTGSRWKAAGLYRGHDGVRDWWKRLLDAYPDFTAEVEDVQDFGDRTISRVLWHGHGAVSDVPMSQTMWLVAKVRQERAIGWHYVSTEAEALKVADD